MSKWVEVRNNYVDEDYISEGIVLMYIDGWKSENDLEEGEVLATIEMKIKESSYNIDVDFKNQLAKNDKLVLEKINEGIDLLKEGYIN